MEKTPDNTTIEMTAVNKMRDAVLRTRQVKPAINDNDKTPSWDGEFLVYSECDTTRKENLCGRIPIQLKGKWVRDFQNGPLSFPVQIADLKNYLQDGGVIFFVVQLRSFDDFRIYYSSLLPFDIRKILDEHGNQETRRIQLELFRHRNIRVILDVLLGFIQDRKRQGKLLPNIRSLKDIPQIGVAELSFSLPAFDGDQPKDVVARLLDRPVYLYAKPQNIEASFVVDKIKPQAIGITHHVPVIVNGERLFDSVTSTIDAQGCQRIKLGPNTVAVVSDGLLHFDVSFSGTLSQQIQQLRFILATTKKSTVYLGDVELILDDSTLHGHTIEELNDRLSGLLKIKKMLDCLNVQKDLDLGQLSDGDIHKLNMLTNGILRNVPVPLFSEGFENATVFSGNMQLGNIKLLLTCRREIDGPNVYIADFFTAEELSVRNLTSLTDELIPISPYVLLTKDMLNTIDNISISNAILSIKSKPHSDIYENYVINFVLELLKWYDMQEVKNTTILNAANEILDYIEETGSRQREVCTINRLQIKKRTESLSTDDNRFLVSLKEPGIPMQFQLAASILLESYIEASVLFDKMSSEDQTAFMNYPIMHLWPGHPC